MPQELQFESHLKKKFALLILTLITRHSFRGSRLEEEVAETRVFDYRDNVLFFW